MSGTGENVRHVTDQLDAVGNTTKALTKGYAMGSAGLAAFLLFSAYLDEVTKFKFLDLRGRFPSPDEIVEGLGIPIPLVDISTPEVFVGGLLGAMLVFIFSALTIRAVRSAASDVIEEVRRPIPRKPGDHDRGGPSGLRPLRRYHRPRRPAPDDRPRRPGRKHAGESSGSSSASPSIPAWSRWRPSLSSAPSAAFSWPPS